MLCWLGNAAMYSLDSAKLQITAIHCGHGQVSAPVWHMVDGQLHGLPFPAEHSPGITHVCRQKLCLAAVLERNGHHSCGATLGASMPTLSHSCTQRSLMYRYPCK